MKLTSLKVHKAHGYLDLDVKLNKQLTFLVGINGSGKTTALRLIEALLTPSLQLLDKTPHERAELRIVHEKRIIKIVSSVSETSTSIEIPSINDAGPLQYSREEVTSATLRSSGNADPIEERYNVIYARFASHPIMVFLRKTLDTPVFLGLDRKNVSLHFGEIDGGENASLNSRRMGGVVAFNAQKNASIRSTWLQPCRCSGTYSRDI